MIAVMFIFQSALIHNSRDVVINLINYHTLYVLKIGIQVASVYLPYSLFTIASFQVDFSVGVHRNLCNSLDTQQWVLA